jgi:hypothetical protein
MPKKVKIPFIHHDGVELMDGYETACDGLAVLNDKELKTWRLIHASSGFQLGRFRTRAIALRAAELHNDIEVDFTMSADEFRALPDAESIAYCSVAACAIAIAEDELKQAEKKSDSVSE